MVIGGHQFECSPVTNNRGAFATSSRWMVLGRDREVDRSGPLHNPCSLDLGLLLLQHAGAHLSLLLLNLHGTASLLANFSSLRPNRELAAGITSRGPSAESVVKIKNQQLKNNPHTSFLRR